MPKPFLDPTVIVAIDTTAQTTIGSSMKSVNSQTHRRKSARPLTRDPKAVLWQNHTRVVKVP